jgi:hypothetical protein
METRAAYNKFFYQEYQTDHLKQNPQDEADLCVKEKEDLKNNYVHSQSIFSEVEFDYNLFAAMQDDAAFKLLDKETKKLIKEHFEKSARLLLVNSTSANRRAKRDGYQKALDKSMLPKAANDDFARESYWTRIKNYFKSLQESFYKFLEFHPSSFLGLIGVLNLYRLSYIFSRLSWKTLWLYFKSIEWLSLHDRLYGYFINIAMMDYPTPVFHLLSIFTFVARVIVDGLTTARHAILPTLAERGLSLYKRLQIEWNECYTRVMNDGWWILINGLTNFPQLFNIPVPVASWILAGCLFFDVLFLSYQLHHEKLKFKARMVWFEEQLSILDNNYDGQETTELTMMRETLTKNKQSYTMMFNLMLKQSEYMLAGVRAMFGVYIGATLLFITSVSLVLTLSSPLVMPLGFFACVFAVAGVLSGGKFGALISARLARSKNSGEESQDISDIRHAKVNDAWESFGLTFAETLIMPMLIIGLFTIHWPSAIALAVLYVAAKNISFPTSNKKPVEEGLSDGNEIPLLDSGTAIVQTTGQELPVFG